MPDFVGVGHICQDHLCVIDGFPPEDGSTRILEIEFQGGGAAATATVAASRLGVSTALIGTLGTDAIGNSIVAELEQEGVDVSGLERLATVKSLFSYVMVNRDNGTRTKFPFKDRMPALTWSEHQLATLKRAKVLHLDGTHYENAIRAAELARSFGVTVSLDGSTRQKDNSLNKALASMANILITNSEYPRLVTGLATTHAALLEMSTWGPSIVMATMGAQGVLAVVEGAVRHYSAVPAKVVDTTGAGDVFHGAFLAAHLSNMSLEKCIDFAQYAAARKCEQIGGRKGIPDRITVETGLAATRIGTSATNSSKENLK